jgi:hypothetical protein
MDNQFQENAIFICGHRKTGTTLMLNLLDNHPQLSVFPVDSNFFYKCYPICFDQNYSTEEILDVIKNGVIKQLLNDYDKFSSSDKADLNFNFENFQRDFMELQTTPLSPKNLLSALSFSFKKNFKNLSTQKKWVEKTTSTEIYATDIFNWFPNAKFIHIIRDPRDNWASLKSGWNFRYEKFNESSNQLLQSLIDRGKLGMELAIHNVSLFGKERYKVIKYEDLGNKPKTIMRDICDFLNIEFDPIVLTPTIMGKPWKGNNFDGLEFNEISNVNVGNWKQRIDSKEAMLVEYHFQDLMSHFDYPLNYSLHERVSAAKEHYKWFNFSQSNSYSQEKDLGV